MQTTLKRPIAVTGVGLHTGAPVRMTMRPAAAGTGVWFRRVDAAGNQWIPARWDAVEPTPLCTRIANQDGVSVSTIEHVMAAIAGCGLANVLVEVDGPELPIRDGSAADFASAILSRGLVRQEGPVFVLRVREPVEVVEGSALARLDPADGFFMDFEIVFDDAAIGTQRKGLDLANGAFVRELCDSRTFCRLSDVEQMRAQGLALGGSMENAVVVDGARIVNPSGLRHRDEAVRHKMLDAMGDLALAGAPIFGRYTGRRAGHALTNRLLRKLFAQPGAVEVAPCSADCLARLPGVGLTRHDLTAVAA